MGKNSKGNLASFAFGAAIGAGLVAYIGQRRRNAPHSLPSQQRINRSLDRALAQARKRGAIPLVPGCRYIIFSDHHKGAGDKADDFRFCKETYQAALDAYDQDGYTLIILGDGEELWENSILEVLGTYPATFEQEKRFYPDRYYRVVGNHDNAWAIKANLAEYLAPLFPDIHIYKSLLLSYQDGPGANGEIFLAHGHQGTLDAEVFDFLPPLVLPLYRQVQNMTGLGYTSPSQNECLRGEHDTMMYRWASRQPKQIFIAGHTHRPVWSSRTHLDKLLWQYTSLIQLKPEQRPEDYEQRLADLQAEITRREAKMPPCNDTIKTRPCYFNTGCCRFADGDITGIEIDSDQLRLVKWGRKEGKIQRTVLEEAPLAEIFALL
jgi:UDP-2,3-diacylglucosamine pyrophosphatase LpxH